MPTATITGKFYVVGPETVAMTDLDIERDSPALQYRLVAARRGCALADEFAAIPPSPEEAHLLTQLGNALPSDVHGRMVVREGTAERLGADAGDRVSLLDVAEAHHGARIEAAHADPDV